MKQSFAGALILVALVLTGSSRLWAQVPPNDASSDTGADDDISVFRSLLSNLPGREQLQVRIAELTSREARIKASLKSDDLQPEDAAAQFHSLAKAYYQGGDNNEAIRILQLSVDAAPDSIIGGYSWYWIGHICYGNLANPGRAIPAYEEADRVFARALDDSTALSQEDREAVLSHRALTVGRLGKSHLFQGDYDTGIMYLESLVDSPDLAQSIPAETLSAFSMELMRGFVHQSEYDRAKQKYKHVVTTLESAHGSSGVRVRLELEMIRGCWPDPLDGDRILRLKQLWEDKELTNTPEILLVGDELVLASYFRSPVQRTEFDKLSKEFVLRSESVPQFDADGKSSDIDRAILRCSLCEIDLASQWSQSNRQRERIQACILRFKGRPMALGIPAGWGRDRLGVLERVYAKFLDGPLNPVSDDSKDPSPANQ